MPASAFVTSLARCPFWEQPGLYIKELINYSPKFKIVQQPAFPRNPFT